MTSRFTTCFGALVLAGATAGDVDTSDALSDLVAAEPLGVGAAGGGDEQAAAIRLRTPEPTEPTKKRRVINRFI